MIEYIRNLTNKQGILFIVWGWINFISFSSLYLVGSIQYSYVLEHIQRILMIALPVTGFTFSALYIYILYQTRPDNTIIVMFYV